MARISPLLDAWGVIHEAAKRLPDEKLKLGFLEALAELEDHECHRTRKFPKTRLHRVVGYREPVYRADIDKISGWRLHLQYENGQIDLSRNRAPRTAAAAAFGNNNDAAAACALKDIVEGQKHDDVLREIEAKKVRYERKKSGQK